MTTEPTLSLAEICALEERAMAGRATVSTQAFLAREVKIKQLRDELESVQRALKRARRGSKTGGKGGKASRTSSKRSSRRLARA